MLQPVLKIIICFLLIHHSAQSQVIDSVVKTENYLRLQYDNDFFSATDRYFTQGIQLSFVNRIVRFIPLNFALFSLKNSTKKYNGLHIQQNCFTPLSIRYDTLNYRERPYAATFYVSQFLKSFNQTKKIALQTEISLGVIGPCALCEDEQKAIHRALLNIQPLGWENQLKTDYIINYTATLEKGISIKKNRELIAQTTLRLGSLYTDASIGFTGRTGFYSPYFSNLGMDKFQRYRKHNFQFYGIVKANAKAVMYNATLQGGLFNNQNIYTINYNRVNKIVIDAMAGIVLTYKAMSFEYSKFYITKEFIEGLDHGWGRCVITVCF